jgi:hypothetical protein
VFRSSLRAVCVVACVCGVRLVRELGLYLYSIVIGLTKKKHTFALAGKMTSHSLAF